MSASEHSKINSPHRIEVSKSELETYLNSPISSIREKKLLDDFEKDMNKKYKKALFIARMQPLHFGHLLAMKLALRVTDNLVIGIGSSNVIDQDNPWTVGQRKEMIKLALEKNPSIREGVSKIMELPDFFSDEGGYDDPKWVEETLRRTGDIEAIVSRNAWVYDLLNKEKHIIAHPLFDREHFQGKKIREILRRKS